ncbi:DUF5320 domain-containing protein [Candidatus Parcubacteria bacterium]|nr:DUF5320 domain-containing protein [Candidatus Parcubacteria bacterium]
MPQLDKTGPRGQGPLTGRGLGPCGTGSQRGAGRGLGRGFGRGLGRGWGCPLCGCLPQVITEKEEKEILKEEALALEEELKEVKKRITEIK